MSASAAAAIAGQIQTTQGGKNGRNILGSPCRFPEWGRQVSKNKSRMSPSTFRVRQRRRFTRNYFVLCLLCEASVAILVSEILDLVSPKDFGMT